MAETSKTGAPARSGADRRRHHRFQPREITIFLARAGGLMRIFGAKGENLATSILDLSEGGLRVAVSRRVPVGAKVQVEFRVDRLKDRLEAEGEVLWIAVHPVSRGQFILGVKFGPLPPERAQMISGWRTYFNAPQVKQRDTTKMRKRDEEKSIEIIGDSGPT